LQTYYDLLKLFRKGSVFSTTTTWLFRFGPVAGLVTAAPAALLVPLGGRSAPVSFPGDMVLFAYLLGLGRFFTMTAALDTGSSFEGMGAAREATYACLAEPVTGVGLGPVENCFQVVRYPGSEFSSPPGEHDGSPE
jgi:formate hydrogenlyase subunit 4